MLNKNDLKQMQPIIIIGMHRSGTSMISRIFEDLGVFMGHIKDSNNEAIFFRKINNKIFKSCYTNWEYPNYTHEYIHNKSFVNKWINIIPTIFKNKIEKHFMNNNIQEIIIEKKNGDGKIQGTHLHCQFGWKYFQML